MKPAATDTAKDLLLRAATSSSPPYILAPCSARLCRAGFWGFASQLRFFAWRKHPTARAVCEHFPTRRSHVHSKPRYLSRPPFRPSLSAVMAAPGPEIHLVVREAVPHEDDKQLFDVEQTATQGGNGLMSFTSVHMGGYGARAKLQFPQSLVCLVEARLGPAPAHAAGAKGHVQILNADFPAAVTLSRAPSPELVSLVARSSKGAVAVAVGTVGVKGVAAAGRPTRAGVIFDLRVRSEARRLGLGGLVTDALEAFSWKHGAAVVYLSVNGDNAGARALYAKQGFTLCSHRSASFTPAPTAVAPMTWVLSSLFALWNARRTAVALDKEGVPNFPEHSSVSVRRVDGDAGWAGLEPSWAKGVSSHEAALAMFSEKPEGGADFTAPTASHSDLSWLRERGCACDEAGARSPTASDCLSGAPILAPLAARAMMSGPASLGTFVAEAVDESPGSEGAVLSRAQVSLVDGSRFGGFMLVGALGLPGHVFKTVPAQLLLWGGSAAAVVASGAYLWDARMSPGADGDAASATALQWLYGAALWTVWGVAALVAVAVPGMLTSISAAAAAPPNAFEAGTTKAGELRQRARLFAPHCEGPSGQRLLPVAMRAAVAEAGRLGYSIVIGNWARGHPLSVALGAVSISTQFMWKPRPATVVDDGPGASDRGSSVALDKPMMAYDCFDPRDL